MILLDTNVLIYAADPASPHHHWARDLIAASVATGGAAVNAVSLAEFCVGEMNPESVADRIRHWGIEIVDVPAAAAVPCAAAYRQFRERRLVESGLSSPNMPLPDFFIGAHAMIMGWDLATADKARFKTCFPSITLKLPE
jgi:predicted nucleic acid-binding protein